MASNSTTFTQAGQVSRDLVLAAEQSVNIILTRTGSGAFSVVLEERRVGDTYVPVGAAYTADTAGTVVENLGRLTRIFRLRCAAVVGGDSIASTLADVSTGEALPGYPVRNAAGTIVLNVTDAGVEAPLFTGPVTGAVTGNVTGNVTGALLNTDQSVGLGANAQVLHIEQATVLKSALSGATVTCTDLIPAGCILLGITTRVTTVITGATSVDIGDGSDADRWGNDTAITAGTTTGLADLTGTGLAVNVAAMSVVLTANGSNFLTGAIRVTAHYIRLTAPTS